MIEWRDVGEGQTQAGGRAEPRQPTKKRQLIARITMRRLLEVSVIAAQEEGTVVARRPQKALRRAIRLGQLALACRFTAEAVGGAGTQLLRALIRKGCLATDRSSLPIQARSCCELLRQFTQHSRKASDAILEARSPLPAVNALRLNQQVIATPSCALA